MVAESPELGRYQISGNGMKLDNYGVFIISSVVLKQMSIGHLLQEFRNRGVSWEAEQRLRLGWIRDNFPDYYRALLSEDLDAAVLFGASCKIDGTGVSTGGLASIWVNGYRSGVIEYKQTREFSKLIAKFYTDMAWAREAFLATYPQFRKNMGAYTWVRRI